MNSATSTPSVCPCATAAFDPQAVPRPVYRAMARAWRVAAAGTSPHGAEFEAELVAQLVYGAEGDRATACRRLAIVLPLLRPTCCRWTVGPVFRLAIKETYPPEQARELISVMARGNVRPAAERLPAGRDPWRTAYAPCVAPLAEAA